MSWVRGPWSEYAMVSSYWMQTNVDEYLLMPKSTFVSLVTGPCLPLFTYRCLEDDIRGFSRGIILKQPSLPTIRVIGCIRILLVRKMI